MKNVTLLVLAVTLAAAPAIHAQLAVIDAGVATLLERTKADQAIYYAQSLVEMYKNAQNTYNQFQNMLRAEQRMIDNLKGVANVKSFDDFMKWHNRQLYLEREREARIQNMGVKIGDKTYKLSNIQDIPDAMRQNYGDEYWNDFSPAQRKEMYTRMGLSPSNYVYLQTWQEREKAIADQLFTNPDVINDDNTQASANHKGTADKYAADKNKPEDEKLQQKEIDMDISMTAMETNEVLRRMAYDQARYYAWQQALREQSKNPPPPPRLSDTWNASPFESLTGD